MNDYYSPMYSKFITWLILFIVLSSCLTNTKKPTVKILETPTFNEISVASKDSIKLGAKSLHLWYWKIVGDKVVAQHPNQDHILYIYSLPDFKLINSYGVIGHGPDEFTVVNWGQTLDDNGVLIYDVMKKKLYDLELKGDSLKTKNIYPLPTFDSNDNYKNLARPFTMIQKLNDDIFLMKVDDTQTTSLEVMDLKKSSILSALPIEFEKRAEVGYSPFDFNISATNKQVVLGYWNMNRIEFYSINESWQLIPKVIIGDNEDQSNVPEEYWRDYYVNMDIDEQYVYFVNNLDVSVNTEKGTYIDIYTLDGTPVNRVILSEHISHILVDRLNNKFYGYSLFESVSIVYIYSLDELNMLN